MTKLIEVNSDGEIMLPKGKWQIYGNEEQGELTIGDVDVRGSLMGEAFGDNISGFFSAPSQEIHFSREVEPAPMNIKVYTGHLSIIKRDVDNPQYLLAGSYYTLPLQVFPQFGWYATITKHSL